MTPETSRRVLQIAVAVLGLVPVSTGAAGVIFGPEAFGAVQMPLPTDLDSHFRYLSGLFLALGLSFYATIPEIEQRTGVFRLLGALVFTGGLARALSLLVAGAPSAGHVMGLTLELVIVPVLVLWQARVAKEADS